jgi:glycosyltransferase involved in cell wall biosynthesis
VSVVTLTYNSERTIEACLRSIVREKPGARIINSPLHSLGYSRQLGVRMARYSLIMFVDSDVILTPNCISKLFHDLDRNGWAAICASVLSLEMRVSRNLRKTTTYSSDYLELDSHSESLTQLYITYTDGGSPKSAGAFSGLA